MEGAASQLEVRPQPAVPVEGTANAQGQDSNDIGSAAEQEQLIREQDRFLPIANIARVMKRPLPQSAKIAKDAKETVQEALSEFISFITSEASDRCIAEKRKTISGEDLIHSLGVLGFDSYTNSLNTYLCNFRDVQRHQNEAKLGMQQTQQVNSAHQMEQEGIVPVVQEEHHQDPAEPVTDQLNLGSGDEGTGVPQAFEQHCLQVNADAQLSADLEGLERDAKRHKPEIESSDPPQPAATEPVNDRNNTELLNLED